jgi:hypothetical protein
MNCEILDVTIHLVQNVLLNFCTSELINTF